jgi:hypothetical protein
MSYWRVRNYILPYTVSMYYRFNLYIIGKRWTVSLVGCWPLVAELCLTQVDRWRHSVSDVVEYVITEKVTRIYFQHTSCIHTPEG